MQDFSKLSAAEVYSKHAIVNQTKFYAFLEGYPYRYDEDWQKYQSTGRLPGANEEIWNGVGERPREMTPIRADIKLGTFLERFNGSMREASANLIKSVLMVQLEGIIKAQPASVAAFLRNKWLPRNPWAKQPENYDIPYTEFETWWLGLTSWPWKSDALPTMHKIMQELDKAGKHSSEGKLTMAEVFEWCRHTKSVPLMTALIKTSEDHEDKTDEESSIEEVMIKIVHRIGEEDLAERERAEQRAKREKEYKENHEHKDDGAQSTNSAEESSTTKPVSSSPAEETSGKDDKKEDTGEEGV
jgi:hypothetical protein